MAKQEKISLAEFDKLVATVVVKGAWKKICEEVKQTGQPQRITDIKRGQFAAVVRAAKEAGLQEKHDNKALWVAIAPTPTQLAEAKSGAKK